MENVVSVNKAIWNCRETLYFDNLGSGSGRVDERGKDSLEADSIDAILNQEEIDFIKMDIEGSEFEALLGAYKTIKKSSPILAVSVYHKQDDFIKIPLLIKALNSRYKLYFRHYRRLSMQETVCYAICDSCI